MAPLPGPKPGLARMTYAIARDRYRRHVTRWLSHEALDRISRVKVRALKVAGKAPVLAPDPLLPSTPLTLGGLLFSSIFNLGDRRKNHLDLLSAFLLAFKDREDATLVIKLATNPTREHHEIGIFRHMYHSLGIEHQCRLVVITDFLTDAQMADLMRVTTFYVNTSKAEGACLPLQQSLAAGRPSIAPDHTSMADFMDDRGRVRAPDQPRADLLAARPVDEDRDLLEPPGLVRPPRPAPRRRRDGRLRARGIPDDGRGGPGPDGRLCRPRRRRATPPRRPRDAPARRDGPVRLGFVIADFGIPDFRQWERSRSEIGNLPIGNFFRTLPMPETRLPMTSGFEPGPPVYFDSNPLSDRHLTGIGRYAARLALAMAGLRPVKFFAGPREVIPPAGMDWSQDQDLGAWARRLFQGTRGPLGTPPTGSVGVWPLLRPIERTFDREVSIVHDLTPLLLPHTHREVTRSHFQGLCSRAIGSSDVALAVSHSTAADASYLMAIDPDRIAVAHSGPSLCVGRHAHAGAATRRPDVGLVVSTLEPRKNPEFLSNWFHTSKALPPRAELWWVGSIGWITSKRDLKQFERRAGSDRRIRFLGVVSDRALCKLYRTAGWSIYPSLYEGFGFPVLDSLRHGTPVLASGNSSIREFDSRGLHLFDPCDAATVDEAYVQMKAEGAVEIPRGPLDRSYSWENVAGRLLEACSRQSGEVEGVAA